MAVITATRTEIKPFADDGHIITWTALSAATSDTGEPIEMIGEPDRSVQISGTFTGGSTCVIEGSNDATTYATLNDLQGSALSFTAAGLKGIAELPRYIRPRVATGTGSINVNMLTKRVK